MGLFSNHVYLLLKGIDSSSSSRKEYKELKRRTSYAIKHGKNCKEVSKVTKQLQVPRQEKNSSPEKVSTPPPLSL